MLKKWDFNDIICLDLSSSTSYKLKKSLIDLIVAHGARVSFILNKKVKYLLKDDKTNLDTYKCKSAFKLKIPIISLNYLYDLNNGCETSLNDYVLLSKQNELKFNKGLISLSQSNQQDFVKKDIDLNKLIFLDPNEDTLLNKFEESKGYEVIKWIVFSELNGQNSYLFELHLTSNELVENQFRIRIEKFKNNYSKKTTDSLNKLERLCFSNSKEDHSNIKHVYTNSGTNLTSVFRQLVNIFLNEKLYSYNLNISNENVGSKALQIVKK